MKENLEKEEEVKEEEEEEEENSSSYGFDKEQWLMAIYNVIWRDVM